MEINEYCIIEDDFEGNLLQIDISGGRGKGSKYETLKVLQSEDQLSDWQADQLVQWSRQVNLFK